MTEGQMLTRICEWMERDHLNRGAWRVLAGGVFWLTLLFQSKFLSMMLMLFTAGACVWLPAWGLTIWIAGIATHLTSDDNSNTF